MGGTPSNDDAPVSNVSTDVGTQDTAGQHNDQVNEYAESVVSDMVHSSDVAPTPSDSEITGTGKGESNDSGDGDADWTSY